MLSDAINGFVSHIIANVPTFTSDTCKGYDDISVFDNAITTMDDPKCVIVSYGGVRPSKVDISEFGGMVVQWFIIINGFFAMRGDDEARQDIIQDGYDFVDNLLGSVVADSTLGGQVMDAVLFDAEPPLEYLRNGADVYLMMAMRFVVTENV